MKVQVEKAALTQVLQKVQSITEKKTNMPILSNTLVKTSDQQLLEFSATDLELSIRTQIGGQIESSGTLTVSARKLLEIVRELPQDFIALEELPNNRLSINAGRSRFELTTIPAEDFPHVSFYPDTEFVACDGVMLAKSLSKTVHGIPVEEDPFSISGLFLHPVDSAEGTPQALRFVSSDGHRLAYYQIAGDALAQLPIGQGIVIPRKGVQEILRALEKESEVSIGIYENCLLLKTSTTLLSVRLLEAEFPEYQLIIPDQRPSSFSADWESLYHALKRVAILTNQKWRHVRFVISSGVLELESGSPDVGNANDAIDIDYEGEGFSVAFNIRYVMDAIQAVESPRVRFEWVDEFHGGVFLGEEDPGFLSLIMPMVI